MSESKSESVVVLAKRLDEAVEERDRALRECVRLREALSKEKGVIAGWSIIWHPSPGCMIDEACRRLVAHAEATNKYAVMIFNGTEVAAHLGEMPREVCERWTKTREAEQRRRGIMEVS